MYPKIIFQGQIRCNNFIIYLSRCVSAFVVIVFNKYLFGYFRLLFYSIFHCFNYSKLL